MDSLAIFADDVKLYLKSNDGRFKQVSSMCPRSPLSLRDLQVAPDGRQLLCVSAHAEQGVCFAVLTLTQNKWLYYDFVPKEFSVTCGVFSPIEKHIVYLGTSNGQLLQFDLRSKAHQTIAKARQSNCAVHSIDVNAVNSHVAFAVGGSVFVHSVRNKVDSAVDYDTAQNSRVLVRFHPTRQFTLGVFSRAEGAAVIDLSSAVVQAPARSVRLLPAPGEGHVCDPSALLWGFPQALVTVAADGRVVQYASKGCGQLYRHPSPVHSATVLREGAELLLGLSDGLACLDLKRKQIAWIRNVATVHGVTFMARAKPHLPIASQSTGVEAMYPQREPANPHVQRSLEVNQRDSMDLISPIKGSAVFSDVSESTQGVSISLATSRRRSSLGSMISPPRSTARSQPLPTLNMPSRRTTTTAATNAHSVLRQRARSQPHDGTITEETLNHNEDNENEDRQILQSTVLHGGDDMSRGQVDFGLDSTSPMKKSYRQPLALRQMSCPSEAPTKEKAVFCQVDSSSRLDSKVAVNNDSTETLSPAAPPSPAVATALTRLTQAVERQNVLLERLVASSSRVEQSLAALTLDTREQGECTRRLVEHALQLGKAHHRQTTSILVELVECQQNGWLDEVVDNQDHQFGSGQF